MALKGGLFSKDSSWDSAEQFYRIGEWIYYDIGGDRSKLARVSINKPGEIKLVKQFDYEEREKTKAELPEICVD